MATTNASLSHLERTAEEPRDNSLYTVRLTHIDPINPTIRLFRLTPTNPPIKFLPGQWLDVYCPSIPKAGGFTITSPPSLPYLELAVQKSPENPPAAWLWQAVPSILNAELQVRVGGSFVWPPPRGVVGLKRVVFVAGGVGVNPLMSMVSCIAERGPGEGVEVRFLYSVREGGRVEEVLFLRRLVETFNMLGKEGDLRIFFTGGRSSNGDVEIQGQTITTRRRRVTDQDLLEALGPVEERKDTVCYICGVPTMTDEFVEKAKKAEGMLEENVLFEKWW
ncbi:ferredoxin reductase-like protein [Mollisia scopiformis]|uniref:Oxidoreductase NAD-binding domain-containing protein 1 n=1 Tax=Mollisia scopiformis TaxID=149040 RepID=A0A194XN01_MOLSC|nr:ferredoxin reductase-like protein [Mollisia scopiformis]KUJ21464.1 ferredoxin reductase-like protein [Mollisia scopiformis]